MAPRVVVVVGTESGYTRMAMNKTIKGWKAGGVDVKHENVLEGSAAPKTAEEFAELAKNFDVIVVATSSFGEGDPPDTLKYFFIALQQAAKAGERPLAGMQHAVLGFGSSMYAGARLGRDASLVLLVRSPVAHLLFVPLQVRHVYELPAALRQVPRRLRLASHGAARGAG